MQMSDMLQHQHSARNQTLCKLSFWNEMHTTVMNTKMPVIFHSECNMSLEEAGLRILAINQHTIFNNVQFHT